MTYVYVHDCGGSKKNDISYGETCLHFTSTRRQAIWSSRMELPQCYPMLRCHFDAI